MPRDAGFVQKACTFSSRNTVNINKSKTIGKHGKVAKKPLYKCISEGLMHGTTGSPHHGIRRNKLRLARPLTRLNFVALRQKMCEIGESVVKKLLPGKVGQSSP